MQPKRLGRFMEFYRQWLGLIVITVSTVALALISWIAIDSADDTSRAEMTRLVFAAVVPLVGTWVGTVLAYNFSRENFEAAAQATKDTATQATKDTLAATSTDTPTPVAQVMVPLSQIVVAPAVADEAAARALTLEELNQVMADRNVTRLPVLTTAGTVLFALHDDDIGAYALKTGVSAPDFDGKTLGDILADPTAAAPITSFETVDAAATVADARAKLQGKPDCKDVFVTEGGGRTDKVQGWLTNNHLARAT